MTKTRIGWARTAPEGWPASWAALALGLCAACGNEVEARFEVSGPGGAREIHQNVTEGGPNPSDVVLTLNNTGTCDLAFAASALTVNGLVWISLAPGSGTVVAAGTGNLTVSFDVINTALRAGTHTGSIQVTGTCTTNGAPAIGSPATVAVNLYVGAPYAEIAGLPGQIGVDIPTLNDAWSATTLTGAPSARVSSAVWTGAEVIVWGGLGAGGALGDGRIYNPLGDSWRPMASDTPRAWGSLLWSGSQALTFGGTDGAEVPGGSRYSPGTDSWSAMAASGAPSGRASHVAVWTGTEMLIWGGRDAADAAYFGDGARYDPVADSWVALPATGAPSARADAVAVWTGRYLLVFGGYDGTGYLADGYRLDVAAGTWSPMNLANAPSGREHTDAVWTGSKMLVWGGLNTPTFLGDGAAYDPVRDAWPPISSVSAPSGRDGHTMAWTGNRMVVWGGCDATTCLATGGIYDPVADSWSSMSTTGAPAARAGAAASWTGSGLVLFGGEDLVGALGSGAQYN